MTVNCKAKGTNFHGTNFKLTPTECSARHCHWHWQWGHGVHNARTQARCDSVGLAVGAHTGARSVTLLGARVTDSESQAANLKAGAHWCPSATLHSRHHS